MVRPCATVCGRGVGDEELEELFSEYGAVQAVRCIQDKAGGLLRNNDLNAQ